MESCDGTKKRMRNSIVIQFIDRKGRPNQTRHKHFQKLHLTSLCPTQTSHFDLSPHFGLLAFGVLSYAALFAPIHPHLFPSQSSHSLSMSPFAFSHSLTRGFHSTPLPLHTLSLDLDDVGDLRSSIVDLSSFICSFVPPIPFEIT